MLVLSRMEDQSVIIGDDIKVMIVGIAGKRVRIGISAPDNVIIHREEIYEMIQKQKKKEISEGNIS